jgi:membrane protein implicated in regulation of membrane protease activity
MSPSLLWLGTGLILIVIELVTGTFYLLVLGLACLAGAAVSFPGLGFGVQAVVAAAVAILGALWVRKHHRITDQPPMASLDVGQPVRWEQWTSEANRLGRVNYRDASWDATVVGDFAGTPGEVLYIAAVRGNELTVSKAKP